MVSDGRLLKVDAGQVNREQRLEQWIESNADILGELLLLVGRQVKTSYGGIIDLLAIDNEGRCVVIELKRGRTPRDIVAQTLDYVSWVAELKDEAVREMVSRRTGKAFADAYKDRFGIRNPPAELNTDQRMLIVATDADEATGRIVNHLTQRYGVDINIVALSYYMVGDQELLARTWVVDPAELENRVESRPSELSGDAERVWTGLWHFNTGAHEGRSWDDERRYGFLSAGKGPKWRDEALKLSVGDNVYAYINGAGYCGGGIVTSTAVRADLFKPPGASALLRDLPLDFDGWFENADDDEMAEYMVGVKWTRTVPASDGLRVAYPLRGTVRKIYSADLAETLRATFG